MRRISRRVHSCLYMFACIVISHSVSGHSRRALHQHCSDRALLPLVTLTFTEYNTINMYLFQFQPIKKSDLALNGRYECPLYKTSERRGILSTTGHSTNYIERILLGTKMTANHWTKRATALICQTNE